MKCHWRKFIRRECELKLKRTTLINQFVMLSFGSSQFMSCEVSRNRTHDEKWPQSIIQKKSKKTVFYRLEKCSREELHCQKHWKSVKKQKEGSKGSTVVGKTVETRNWLEYVSNTNKHGCWRKEAHVIFSFGNSFSLQTPKYINLKIKLILQAEKSCFYFIGK